MEIINNRNHKRKRSIDISTMVYGKIPPQAKDLEEAVLGAILLEKTAFDNAAEILKPECFYVDAHRVIFEACQSLSQKHSPIDITTVVYELKAIGKLEEVGGPYYVTKLTNAVVSSASLEAHCKLILEKFIGRELIRISGEIIGDAYEDTTDIFDLMDDAERKISNVTLAAAKKPYSRLDNVMNEALNKVEHLRNHPGTISGVPTGIFMLDQITRGWQPTDFIIIAARPGIGKSALAVNLARAAAIHEEKPVKVGLFTLEMSSVQLSMRLLSAESEIPLDDINRGKVDNRQMDRLHKATQQDWVKKVVLDDTPALRIVEFRSKVRKMVLQDKIGLIIVDYLQLMTHTQERNQNREQEISTISRNCKAIAKELNIPVIALSQLSRAVETRHGSKQPILSDLRESGAIEQDADVVVFLIPPEENEVAQNADLKDSHFVKIAKHRNGKLDFLEIKFAKEIQKIMNRSEYKSYTDRMAYRTGGFVPMSDVIDFSAPKENNSTDEGEGDLPF